MSNKQLRAILYDLHRAATDAHADIMWHPTWSLDYSAPFTLTVKQLRGIHEYLILGPSKEKPPKTMKINRKAFLKP